MHRDFLTLSIRNLAHKQDVKEDQVTTSFLYIVTSAFELPTDEEIAIFTAVGQNHINFIIEKNPNCEEDISF